MMILIGRIKRRLYDSLIENGTNFIIDRKPGIVSFRATGTSDANLGRFRSIVRDQRVNRGLVYDIHIEHKMIDRGGDIFDAVPVTLDDD